tara:strand:- start:37562 stop:37948 length:387 start_codon:yes stop_codon:yes gene_type:complete
MIALVGIPMWFLKNQSKKMELVAKDFKESSGSIVSEMNKSLDRNRLEQKEELDKLQLRFDSRFDDFSKRLETSSSELKDLLYRETATLKIKDQEQDDKISNIGEKVTKVNEDLLNFKLLVSEQYQKSD